MNKEDIDLTEKTINDIITNASQKSKDIIVKIATAKTNYKKTFYKKKLKKANCKLADILVRAEELKQRLSEIAEQDEHQKEELNTEMG